MEWIWHEAVLFEKMRGLPNDCCMPDRALCCFVRQREVPHANSKEILRKGDPRKKETIALCMIQCLLWKAGRRQELGIHCSWRERSSCAIVWPTLDVTWRCNSSSKSKKSFHFISSRSPQPWPEAWGNSWRSLTHIIFTVTRPHTQSEVCNSSHTITGCCSLSSFHSVNCSCTDCGFFHLTVRLLRKKKKCCWRTLKVGVFVKVRFWWQPTHSWFNLLHLCLVWHCPNYKLG